jgi:hypothetical protein
VVVMLRLGSRAWTSHSMSSSDGTNWNFSTAVDGKWLSGAAYYISAKSSGGSRVTSASAASPHTLTIR